MAKPKWFSLAFFKEWALLTLSFASGGFTVLLGLAFYMLGKEPPKSGILILLQMCSIGAAWGAWSQERTKRLTLLESRKPRLVVLANGFRRIDGVFEQKHFDGDGSLFDTTHLPFRSLILRVENDPIQSTFESVAKDVAARLTFLNLDGQDMFSMEGRWSDSTQPPNLEQHRTAAELKTATIPIGSYRDLDLVLKYNDEVACHAVNNDSYGFKMFQNPAWCLNVGDYQIKVRLRGPSVDQTFVLKFRNPKGTEPLEPLSCD